MVAASLVKLPQYWMSLDFTDDDQSTLAQVMAWCRQATSHYLSQCWPRSLSPYGVTRPQWVNALALGITDSSTGMVLTMEESFCSQFNSIILAQSRHISSKQKSYNKSELLYDIRHSHAERNQNRNNGINKPTEWRLLNWFFTLQNEDWFTPFLHKKGCRALFQYPIRHLIVGIYEVSKSWDLFLKLSDCSEIWEAVRQHCCWVACQISKQYDNSNYQSRGSEALWNLTIRRLIDIEMRCRWLKSSLIEDIYYRSYRFNTKPADDLAKQGAMASAELHGTLVLI